MDIHSNYHCLEHLQREFSLKCLKLLKVRAFWIASAMTKATFQRHSRPACPTQPHSPTLPRQDPWVVDDDVWSRVMKDFFLSVSPCHKR